MEQRRRKYTIILTTCALHLLALLFLFVFYHAPEHRVLFAPSTQNLIDTPQTIFYEPDPQPQEDRGWAELKPRASTMSNSLEMPEEREIGVEPLESFDKLRTSEQAIKTDPSKDSEQSNEISSDLNKDGQLKEKKENPLVLSLSKDSSESKKSTQSTKQKASQALAGITRGYLEQLQHEGENLIKTIGGDPNKRPTDEQLKYERYLAKIQWCLQNAHNINQEKCPPQPLQATMKVYFILHRNGTMEQLKIVQSSGNAFADQYILGLFTTAASSFPPVPAYIKEDPLPLWYTVMINWNTSSYMGFSRQ